MGVFYSTSLKTLKKKDGLELDPEPDPDPLAIGTDPGSEYDPHQHVTDPQYWWQGISASDMVRSIFDSIRILILKFY
jgi:hypothetical protein